MRVPRPHFMGIISLPPLTQKEEDIQEQQQPQQQQTHKTREIVQLVLPWKVVKTRSITS